jgi:hypothetical protein
MMTPRLSHHNTLHILSTKVKTPYHCHLSGNFLMAAALSLSGRHTPNNGHYSESCQCLGIICHAIIPSPSCQTGHNLMGPTQVSMANAVNTVDTRDATVSVV